MKTLFVMALFLSGLAQAQHTPNKWVIGTGSTGIASNNILDFTATGLNILSPIPNPHVPFLVTNAAIGDTDSTLLFYTNGYRICNAQHATIQNGDTLSPSAYTYANLNNGSGLSQMAVFIPDPADSNRFYLFHASGNLNIQPCSNLQGGYVPNKIYYSLIDKTLDNGKGGVIIKNNIISSLADTFGQSLLAVKHGNGRDWWLIACHLTQSLFYRWLITPNGVTNVGVQNIGSGYCGGFWSLKFSSLTNTIAGFRSYFIWPTTRYIDLFNFDRCTGLLSNVQTLQMFNTVKGLGAGGCGISPSGRYLYGGALNILYQFDLLASNIQASMLVVDSVDSLDLSKSIAWGPMQLGIDNKLYANNLGNSNFYLGVINKPDSAGIACDAVHGGIVLPNVHYNDLPNIPLYELGALAGSACDTLTAIAEPVPKNKLLLYPNPANKWLMVNDKWLNGLPFTLTVYDVLGKIQVTQNTNSSTIDISTLTPGLYVLRLQQGDKMYYGRFVKE